MFLFCVPVYFAGPVFGGKRFMQMQTFEELYHRVLEMNRNRTDFNYDPSQMDALFSPRPHRARWQLDGVMTEENKTLDGKPVSKDTAAVLRALAKRDGRPAFVLVAPAFYGQFSDGVMPGMLRSAFHKMGFDGFLEVAVFADILTLRETLEFDRHIHTREDYILTSCCCPMWLAMIKKQYADLIPHVPPSVSPMIAAGRTVKKLHPEALTVFVGPCIAKKAEAREKDIAGAVDYVLTFQEIQQMLDMLQIDLTRQPNITREYSSGLGRIYARNGGVSQAVAKTLERLHPNRKIKLNAQKADGVPECRRMIDDLVQGRSEANFFEGMGCAGGCIGGPKSLLDREDARIRVNAYGRQARYETPLDNPYVLKLLHSLNFTTLDSLLEDKEFFVRSFE